jgi:arylformamidase
MDVTYPIRAGFPVWPGSRPVELDPPGRIEKRGQARVSRLALTTHTGTHLDAPSHFLADGDDITTFPLSCMTGHVRVCEARHPGQLTTDDLLAYERRTTPLTPGDRLFFRTRNSDRDWTREDFDRGYAAVPPDLAELLVRRGIDVIGVDYLSVAPFVDPAPTHLILLEAGVWVMEALDLRSIPEGRYDYVAMPMKLAGSDGAPLRVILRPR